MPEQGDTVRAHCNTCEGDRKHHVIFCYAKKQSYRFEMLVPPKASATRIKKWREELKKRAEELSDIYELLQCAGCEDIRLRHTSEHLDVKGKLVPTITYYHQPPSAANQIGFPGLHSESNTAEDIGLW
jgi:hypothetical protein